MLEVLGIIILLVFAISIIVHICISYCEDSYQRVAELNQSQLEYIMWTLIRIEEQLGKDK